MTLLERVKLYCATLTSEQTCWVALSGGMDSLVLLSICHELRKTLPFQLRAVHINHGLSANADAWVAHCRDVCATLQIDFVVHKLNVKRSAGASLEELARNQRYEMFKAQLQTGDLLLTAHHQKDQTETLLLQLLRGAGLKGLAAMPSTKVFGNGLLVRPFLQVSYDDLFAFATENNLDWIQDESNDNVNFDRNYLRHEILPKLAKRWPSTTTTIARAAKHCAEAQTLLDEYGLTLMQSVAGDAPQTLSISKLRLHTPAQQRLILRAWIDQAVHQLPSEKKLLTLQQQMLQANVDRSPCVRFKNICVRRYQDELYVFVEHPLSLEAQIWQLHQPLPLPGLGFLHAVPSSQGGFNKNIHTVAVKFRQGGERIKMTNRGTQILKNLFQEWRIPPWERARMPLIFVGNELAAVVGQTIAADYFSAHEAYQFQLIKTH